MSDSSDNDETAPPSKRLKPSGPTKIVTWNANGLVSRCNWNKEQVKALLRETQADVLCLQEVRLKATSPTNRGTPLASDYKSIKEVMDAVFGDYDQHWSLASTKYSGTLTLIHKRHGFPKQDAAFCTEAAVSLLLKKHNLTREDVGLPDPKRSAASAPKKKQSTMTAFFKPKPSSKTSTGTGDHQEEGRFQFFSFDNFDLINTYVPNNGTKAESFRRRREWDEQIKTLFSRRKTILRKAEAVGRPLIWCGDFNCAMTYRDGTHWESVEESNNNKQGNSDTPGIYEWWRDESQCFVAAAAKKLESDRDPGDIGIPSFTSNERRRFAEIFREGDLKDVWRYLHPNGVTEDDNNPNYKTQWDRPNWTWRGHLAKEGNQFGSKYQGKGQRLDYFLLSPSNLTSSVVEKCDILGYGEKRQGYYCGSDHCAVMLELKKPL